MKSNIKSYKIGEVSQIFAGGDKPKNFSKTISKELKVPVYSNGETNMGLQGYTDNSRVNQPSVTVSARGTIGYAVLREVPFVPIVRLLTLTPYKDKLDLKYLYYFLTLYRQKGLGSSQEQLTVPDIANRTIFLPSLKVQQAVGKILHILDKRIELNNKINDELEKMAKLIYNYWFVQFDFPDERGKPYKSNGGKMVWSDELKGEIPLGWRVSSVSNLLENTNYITDKIQSKDILKDGNFPVITQDAGSFISGYTNRTDPITSLPVIIFGDHSCTLRYVNFPFFRGADGTQILKLKKNLCFYIYQFLEKVIKQIPNYGKYERHFKYVKDLKVVIPPDQTLFMFESLTGTTLEKIKNIRQENKDLENLRDWLLPMLMNGQVTISN